MLVPTMNRVTIPCKYSDFALSKTLEVYKYSYYTTVMMLPGLLCVLVPLIVCVVVFW